MLGLTRPDLCSGLVQRTRNAQFLLIATSGSGAELCGPPEKGLRQFGLRTLARVSYIPHPLNVVDSKSRLSPLVPYSHAMPVIILQRRRPGGPWLRVTGKLCSSVNPHVQLLLNRAPTRSELLCNVCNESGDTILTVEGRNKPGSLFYIVSIASPRQAAADPVVHQCKLCRDENKDVHSFACYTEATEVFESYSQKARTTASSSGSSSPARGAPASSSPSSSNRSSSSRTKSTPSSRSRSLAKQLDLALAAPAASIVQVKGQNEPLYPTSPHR